MGVSERLTNQSDEDTALSMSCGTAMFANAKDGANHKPSKVRNIPGVKSKTQKLVDSECYIS